MDALAPIPVIGNPEIETAVLGAILMDNDAYQQVASMLTPEHFVEPIHGRLYGIMASRIAVGDIVDARTIKGYLRANEQVQAREFVADLISDVVTTKITGYAKQIVELSVRRRLLDIARDAETAALESAPNEPVAKLLEEIEEAFASLRQSHHVGGGQFNSAATVNRAMEIIGSAHRGERSGLPWMLREIEMVMGGPMQPGALYGLLGSSGEGKTSFVLQTLRFLAEHGIPVLFLSSEQTAEICVLQMQAQKLGIELHAMLKKDGLSNDEADRIFEDAQALSKLPWVIENWTDCKVSQLGLKVRNFVKRYGPGVVAIDHAKKIVPDNPRDIFAQQIAQVFSGAHDLMAETRCSGILVMQRNSDFLKRPNMWPARADAYGGEGTLQNLDGCLTMFRAGRWMRQTPAYLNGKKEYRERVDAQVEQEKNRVWFGNLKNRFGEENRRAKAEFIARWTRFVSFDQERLDREPELLPV